MPREYSIDVCRELEARFRKAQVHRPMRVRRYDAGSELVYDVTGVSPRSCLVQEATGATVRLIVEKFVGGGFAGQVYKVKILEIRESCIVNRESSHESQTTNHESRTMEPIDGLEVGRVYAMKLLIPPSSFSRLFRNLLYWIGFQGPFQLQVNPAAARAGALWQKFIRRGAKIRFGDENAVVDIHATFVDSSLGSCGELGEWVDGRTWRLEVDDHLDQLSRWRTGRQVDAQKLGSPEYRAKYEFMHRFVELLHDMGGYEFARQYEWSTCKSQPNCLKRQGANANPSAGLVAVDFRAGLALLPFLPMSPGDVKLIATGIMRGSLVQFDRGNVDKLEAFVKIHGDEFADIGEMLSGLKMAERIYRNSVPDITHNHVRLLCSRQLWSTILDGAITGWKVRNLIDEQHEKKLRQCRVLTLLFFLIGLIPLLGCFLLKIWGRLDWRKHYVGMLTSWGYLRRAVRARIAERVVVWHRAGRVDGKRALKIADELWRFFCHVPLSVLPAGVHRFLSDWAFFKDKLHYLFLRPIKLYFSAKLREEWLRDMVNDGKRKHILTDQDAGAIMSQLDEPYVQRYLVSLVVHLMTLPLTQIVSAIVAWIYYRKTGDELGAGGILVLFQIIPISPGSIARGLYAVGIMIYDRSFKDYNVAVFLSFFKYIGYLAFPIQMTYRYPALARFMAAHWATGAVHIVPVFGERGALLEHWVFRLFYNWPLTIRRRMRRRAEIRASMAPRYWHVGLCVIAAAAILGLADFMYLSNIRELPGLKDIWWLVATVPFVCGAVATLGCGGAALGKRLVAAGVSGVLMAVLYAGISAILSSRSGIVVDSIMARCVWRVFIFTILSTIGAVVAELKLSDPDLK